MANTENTPAANTVRTLKVYEKMISRQSRFCGRSYTILCPEIRLMGKWLEECGFVPGQHVEIRQEQGRLVITHAWSEDQE